MALVVFCVLKADTRADLKADKRMEATDVESEKRIEQIRKELKQMVSDEMGKPLAPKAVLFVSDLPKTRNAKVMRRMIRAAYLGQEPGDTSSLVNPEAVEEIKRAR
jgi:acyl-coenzyme A synthetase/AMP-(fatty) acid ligase